MCGQLGKLYNQETGLESNSLPPSPRSPQQVHVHVYQGGHFPKGTGWGYRERAFHNSESYSEKVTAFPVSYPSFWQF